MPKLEDLQKRRQELAGEIRKKHEKFNSQGKKWVDDEERANWAKLNADYDSNKAELDAEKAANDVDARAKAIAEEQREREDSRHPIPGQEDTRSRTRDVGGFDRNDPSTQEDAFRGWMAAQMEYDDQIDQRTRERWDQAMAATGIRPWQRGINLRMLSNQGLDPIVRDFRAGNVQGAEQRCLEGIERRSREQRAMSGALFASGAGLVFPSLMNRLEVNMLAFGGVRQVATTLITASGEELGMPTADDTSNEGSQIGENQSVGTSTEPSIGRKTLGAWTFTSKPVLVPYSLLQDSRFDITSMLGGMLGERLGRGTNRKYTTGGGTTTARGIVTAATLGRTSEGSGAITYTDLIALEHSVDPAYRIGAGFMCHDTTMLAIRTLKDSQNRPLWTSGTDTNSTDRLNGRPMALNQHMDAGTTSANKALLFGQLSKYHIRRAGVARFYRLEERYRDTDQDGFVMLIREDGNLLEAGTAPVKYLLIA